MFSVPHFLSAEADKEEAEEADGLPSWFTLGLGSGTCVPSCLCYGILSIFNVLTLSGQPVWK